VPVEHHRVAVAPLAAHGDARGGDAEVGAVDVGLTVAFLAEGRR
jgi:hypothetical protein